MTYQSVDALQRALAETIFADRVDVKKAAGRALGTIVELITFYVLREWGLLANISIERGLAEFANDEITHNVEFGIHPVIRESTLKIEFKPPLTTRKIIKAISSDEDLKFFCAADASDYKDNQLLSSSDILRNACTLVEADEGLVIANLIGVSKGVASIGIAKLRSEPFAMVECKRVGIEDGQKKGPTTIEKAKQGAYVAKHVSSLQKIRGRDGTMFGAMPNKDGSFAIREIKEELRRLIFDADKSELDGFILTVGVVSNHGNWFTAENQNKELLVLKQSYDWLLFLTDPAIGEFVEDTILSNDSQMAPVRMAFSDSYTSGDSGKNQFTKVRIGKAAHDVLADYFHKHIGRIEEAWFNILAPGECDVHELKIQLGTLSKKL